ncbi:MAG: BTAD domain-containing putative transcriptional regulator [Nocardioides sp.]
MEVAVLGPVEARLDAAAEPVDLGTPKQRALVAALALSSGRPVAVDTIVDLLWGDSPPGGVTGTLQAYVSGLRRVLEPTRERRAPASILVTASPGYALRLEAGALDAERFERTVDDEHRRAQLLEAAGPPVLSEGELTDSVQRLDDVLSLWRGTPYAELEDAPAAVAERTRLEELRLVAREDRAVLALALGQHGTVAAELEAMTAAHPLRERLWGLRALALTRAGRQADALAVLREVRDVLGDELGIEPGAELRDLQTAVLRQDPGLEWVAPPRQPGAPVVPLRRPAVAAPPGQGPEWPMAGRDADLEALVGAWHRAQSGTTTYAVLTGEPGIGKSRLAAELIARARAEGARICVGRCSQDEGAPPLWPWGQVLQGLGAQLPRTEDIEDTAQFAAFERLVEKVRQSAREQPLVVGIDDLHWADPCTLRVLRLLVETAEDDRLLVLATWRDSPEPTGGLADVAEALARRHAVRRELRGLTVPDVADVFASVARNRPTEEQAQAVHDRTDGNPFFVVEYARLAGERTDLTRMLTDDPPPAGVQEVLARRLARLPDATVATLRTAAVIGRRFDAETLARAAVVDEDDLLDVVEPAEAAGLVREVGLGQFTFAHALVRDALTSGLSASRRARAHARVAEAMGDRPERAGERALHWRAAGPSYAGRAWRAGVQAAEAARAVFAHDEAAALSRAALDSLAQDPTATSTDRYDVLMQLVDAYRWSARWPELVATVEEAVSLARDDLGDVERTARAAVATSQGALWQSAGPGEVHEAIMDALRWSLDRLPEGDGATRCRVLMALANELIDGAPVAERLELAAQALEMARRLGDEPLLLDACQIGFAAAWWAGTAIRRLALAEESLALADRLGRENAAVVSACLYAVTLGELGRPDEMRAACADAVERSERMRIPYGLLVIENLLFPWLVMGDRLDEARGALGRITELEAQVALDPAESAVAGAQIVLGLWRREEAPAAVDILRSLEGGPVPITSTVVTALCRAGRVDEARAHRDAHEIRLEGEDIFSLLNWCMSAEAALHLEDPALGRAAYSLLAPYAGRSCCVGSGFTSGPVDLYLAFAAAAAGELDAAAAHADHALGLCEAWRLPLPAQWLRDQRDRYGF